MWLFVNWHPLQSVALGYIDEHSNFFPITFRQCLVNSARKLITYSAFRELFEYFLKSVRWPWRSTMTKKYERYENSERRNLENVFNTALQYLFILLWQIRLRQRIFYGSILTLRMSMTVAHKSKVLFISLSAHSFYSLILVRPKEKFERFQSHVIFFIVDISFSMFCQL